LFTLIAFFNIMKSSFSILKNYGMSTKKALYDNFFTNWYFNV